MKMFEGNTLTYPTNQARNWSTEERELNKYLEREWSYRPSGTGRVREFCMGDERRNWARRRTGAEPHAWHGFNVVTALLVALRLRKP